MKPMTLLKKWHIASFDSVVEKFSKTNISFTEEEALRSIFWEKGEDARFREDFRFRQTPGGRWILSNWLLANNQLYSLLHRKRKYSIALGEALSEIGECKNKPWAFCKADKRFVFFEGNIRLSENELSGKMMTEDEENIEKYGTHLPVHSLEAVAASEPLGEWGPAAQEEMVEKLGWVKVTVPGLKLNDRMFVARIKGSSMDDGRSGLADGSYAVFELWPAGTRQDKIVLVQGSFKDPETGSYAIKKYTADVRDDEGFHRRIALVSLNPDKRKYPDIVLNLNDERVIKVVAQLITSLSSRQYARQPKQLKKTGRRNLEPEHVTTKMRQRLKVIFEKEVEKGGGNNKRETQIRLVCLDFTSGGLHVETDPQIWLPNFVKKVVLQSDRKAWNVLGSNLKNLKWRQGVPPSTTGYSWSAPGFEDETDDRFSKLRLGGLPENAVTVFKVDALGIGRQILCRTLTPGQEYRVVVPPIYSGQKGHYGLWNSLDSGWQLWEFSMPAILDGPMTELFGEFGLVIGKATPRLDWVLNPPIEYLSTPRGETIPCFAAETTLYLSIKGIDTFLPDEAHVFVINGATKMSFPLSRGNGWYFAIEEPVPGRGLVSVLHKKTVIGRAELPFFISDKDPEPVKANLSVKIEGRKRDPDPDGDIFFKGDLRLLGTEKLDLKVQASPLWSVFSKWQDVGDTHFSTIVCEPDGEYDTAPLLACSKRHRDFQAPGNLVLDLSELGRLIFQHEPIVDPDEIRKRFLKIIESAGDTLPKLAGQFQLLIQLWFTPILQAMGFIVVSLPKEDLCFAPDGVTALLIKISKRKGKSHQIELVNDKIIVIAKDKSAIPLTGNGSAREFADELCDRHGVQVALITDGRCWMRHKQRSKLRAKIYDLLEFVHKTEGSEDFELFLSEIGGL